MFFIGNLNVKYVFDYFLDLFSGYAVNLSSIRITGNINSSILHTIRYFNRERYFVIISSFKLKCFKTAAICQCNIFPTNGYIKSLGI